ncbi:MAG: hypothetical protein EA413_09155 [Cyanobium sp. PLM2.Bin73]|nr:MAG: hypothetical protein EA413_09155 [Cyanobium sp. PLM2.Bin73]
MAAAAVVGNDSLQTLGTFLSSNRGRTPLPAQMAFLLGLTAVVLGLGWWLNGGDPAWGRLAQFPLPDAIGWIDLLPPLAVLLLTRWGAPVSTSVLLLTAIAPANAGPVLLRSLIGYGLAFATALLLYGAVLWLLERPLLDAQHSGEPEPELTGVAAAGLEPGDAADAPRWLVLQWLSTAWLWSQWLVHDLANIFILLPRQLQAWQLGLSAAALGGGLCALVAWGGGPIQRMVQDKVNTSHLRSATLIDLLFGALLLALARFSPTPLSTTWVFLGLLAGRELGLLLRLRHRPALEVGAVLVGDLGKASLALALSLAVALLIQPLKAL